MSDWRFEKVSLASKCEFFWTTNWDFYGDVTFIVGPNEEKIKGFKILLMVTSPVFEAMFGVSWSTGRGQDDPIILAHTDPTVFRLFLRLLLMENITVSSIMELNLTMDQLFELFFLSKEYLIHSLRTTLEGYIRYHLMQVDNVLKIFEQVQDKDEEKLEVDTFRFIENNAAKVFELDDFLKISKHILLKILSSDHLLVRDELLIFQTAYRWAEYQATLDESFDDNANKKRKVEHILLDCLSEIRFPLITCRDLAFKVRPTGVLTEEEIRVIFDYRRLPADKRKSRFGSILRLSDRLSVNRKLRNFQSLVLAQKVDTPEYLCTGQQHVLWLRASENVKIRRLGFCGPLRGDSDYEVSVFFLNSSRLVQSSEETKRIAAKENTTFYFQLNTPILIEKDTWYFVNFKLRGAPTASTDVKIPDFRYMGLTWEPPPFLGAAHTLKQEKITFAFLHEQRQIMEIQYTPECFWSNET